MTSVFSGLRSAGAVAAIASVLVLTGCDKQPSSQTQSAYSLPDLPATMPLAPGEATAPVFAPAVDRLPRARLIDAVQPVDPGNAYAYADDAWGFDDALGYAPPDYGFYYDDVEPWAWQGYDDSLVFAEPLDYGYRYYYYRAGFDDPYFIRDPYYGYGYDDGRVVVIYNSYGGIVPYASYGPRLDYASRYYWRGRDLYGASHRRHAVIGANWAAREASIAASRTGWYAERSRVAPWQDYHNRYADQRSRYWSRERTRRQADAVRFAAWRSDDFRSPPPPRAIPADWKRARWAQDKTRFAPPAGGFDGNAAERRHAIAQEQARVRNDRRQFASTEIRERVARPVEHQQRTAFLDRASERRDLRQARAVEGARDRAERRADRFGQAQARQSRREIGEARVDRVQASGQQRLGRQQQAETRSHVEHQRQERAQAVQQQRVERERRQAVDVRQDRVRQQEERLTQRNARVEQSRVARETRVQARRQSEVRAEAQQRRQVQESRMQARRQSEGRAQAEQQRQPRQDSRMTAMRQQSEQRTQARTERQAQVQQARSERQQARVTRQESPGADQRANRVETARADRPNREDRGRNRP